MSLEAIEYTTGDELDPYQVTLTYKDGTPINFDKAYLRIKKKGATLNAIEKTITATLSDDGIITDNICRFDWEIDEWKTAGVGMYEGQIIYEDIVTGRDRGYPEKQLFIISERFEENPVS